MTQTVKNTARPNGIANAGSKDLKAIPVPQSKREDLPQPTLEKRIQKVEELRSLTEKRQRLIATLNQLRTFNFASDDNCNLMLTDGQGQKFHTSNSTLIGLLKDYFMSLLNDKVSALDDEIMAFKL